MSRHRTELLIGLFTGALSLAVLLFSSLRFPNDDQFILYRYIDNIVSGNGFVYNLGEKVLGATTPLFTLLAALGKWLFPAVSTPDIVAYINIILLSLSAIFFYRVARHFLSAPYALLAVVVYALNLTRTIPEGMETPLFLFTTFGFLSDLLKGRHYRSSVFLALSILTRPDAGLIAVLAAAYWLTKLGWQTCIRLMVTAALVIVPWLIFATLYFGSFVPQSLATKMHSADIYNLPALQATKVQAAHISRVYWGKLVDPENIPVQVLVNLLPILLLSVYGAWRLIKKRHEAWLIVSIPLIYFVSFSISNPPIFPWYLSEMEPFWILLSIVGFAGILSFVRKPLRLIAAIVLLSGPLWSYGNLIISSHEGSKATAFAFGEYLKEHAAPGETLGIADIGIMGYVSEMHVIDFIGLVSPESVPFYPFNRACAPQELYIIPPMLIEHARPDWFVAGDPQMDPCYQASDNFASLYEVVHERGNAKIYRLKAP